MTKGIRYSFFFYATLATVMVFFNALSADDLLQDFLDNYQYTPNNISRYERVLGDGCLSMGGKRTTNELVAMLDLQSGQRVLDIGCGVGGADFYMSRTFGVKVKGIDLSENMIAIANKRRSSGDKNVDFERLNVIGAQFMPESFDVVYTRETLHYVADKEAVLKKIYSWLKPGGTLLVTDYCCGTDVFSQGFKDYIAEYHYHFLDVESYATLLSKAGFEVVRAEDRSEEFIEIHVKELKEFEAGKEPFLREFSIDDFYHIVYGWRNKIDRCSAGEQKWGVFVARKPKNA